MIHKIRNDENINNVRMQFIGFVEGNDKQEMSMINGIADELWNRKIGLKYDYTQHAYLMFFNVQ